MNCKNCTSEIQGGYCGNCGNAAKLKRIDGQFILHEIEHVLHFEKGLFFTIRELLLRPGKCVREYIYENRNRLVKPIIFIILTSLIYTLVAHFFHIEKGIIKIGSDQALAVNVVSNWMHDHYGYANIIMGFFIACWLKVFFRKHDVNFFEISMLLSFFMGMAMLFLAVAVVLNGITGRNFMPAVLILSLVYISWAIGQFFDQGKSIGFIKAGIAYAFGVATYSASVWALGSGYNAIMK